MTLNIKKEDSERISCEDCGKGYYKGYYKEHRTNMHESSSYKCEFCDEYFANALYLTAHKTQHANKFKYKCDKCGNGFLSLSNLKIHKQSYHEAPTVTCGKCDKSFEREEFKQHLATHRRVKRRHICAVCSAVFYSKNSLERHVLHHEFTT